MNDLRRWLILLPVCVFAFSCATSPLGRKQLILMPDSQMDAMGVQAFQQMKEDVPVEKDTRLNSYVRCVVNPLIKVVKDQRLVGPTEWEVVVFKDQQVNAFALPGGRIGVYAGLLKVAKTDAQLAAVIGHEIAHVIARHGNERVSEGVVAQLGQIGAAEVARGSPHRDSIMAGLGLATQVGVLLPHSRTQETESDLIGVDLMARAGFDPSQSVVLWQNMAKAGGAAPPEFLSTHPASESRIVKLQENLPPAEVKYRQALSAGYKPKCSAP